MNGTEGGEEEHVPHDDDDDEKDGKDDGEGDIEYEGHALWLGLCPLCSVGGQVPSPRDFFRMNSNEMDVLNYHD